MNKMNNMTTAITVTGLATFLLALVVGWCQLEIRRLDKQLAKNRAQLRKLNRAINAMSMGLPESTREAMVRVNVRNNIDVGTFGETTKRWPAHHPSASGGYAVPFDPRQGEVTNVIPMLPTPASRIERILQRAQRPMTWTEIVSAAGQVSPIDLIRSLSELKDEGRVQLARTFDATPAWTLNTGDSGR